MEKEIINSQDQLLSKEKEHKNKEFVSSQDHLLFKNNTEEKEEKNIKENAFEEAMLRMFEDKNIEMTSDVNKPLILAMSRGDIFAKRFNSEVLAYFMKRILIRSVSNGRKGRGELVALVRNSQDVYEEPSRDLSALARVLGKS